jgi:hypothetical protein
MTERVSDEFDHAFGFGGTDGPTQCTCGRHHISTLTEQREELAAFEEKAKELPGRYFIHTDTSIGVLGGIGGAVWGCECGTDVRHEKWLWERREMIAQYFRERMARELRQLQEQAEKMTSALGSLP